jgi:nucleoside-diphosphate-sugar epimerase
MILITGVTGFIGSRLAEQLHTQGKELVLLGRLRSDTDEQRSAYLQSLGLHVSDVDLVDDDLIRHTENVDTVIHLAAAQHEANQPEAYFKQVNVTGTRRLLEASIQNGARRFIYGSTIGVYGNVVDGEVTDSTPEIPDNHYGRTKFEAEKTVAEYSDQIQTVVARISETYGPGDFRLLKLFSGIQKGFFFVIGSGENKHQLVFVDDLVAALCEMIHSPAAVNQTIVLAGDEVMTTWEMCEAIATSVGRPLHRIRAPMWPFHVLAIVLEQTLGRIGIQPPLHRRRLDFFRKSLSFSSEKTNEILTWRPTTKFADGTQHTANWYRDRRLLRDKDN